MIIINGISSAIIFALIAILFNNPPIVLGIIGFFSGIIVAIILNKLIK